MAGPPQYQSTGRWLPNMLDLDHLVQKVQDVQDIRQKMQQLQEELHERKNNEALQGSSQQSELDPTKSEVQKLQTHIQQLEDNMKEMAKKRIQLLNECTDCLDQCLSRWISRLKEWRWEQQKAIIGHPFDNNLDPLQSWCEQLFEVNKNLREELELVGEPMSELQDRLVKLLKVLVQSSLVVDKQPPRLIKIHSVFSTTVRCLLGEKLMPVMLKAKIINELQARDLDSGPSEDAGELENDTANLEPDTGRKGRFAIFLHMCIKNIKRPDRRGSKPETEQKFALLFSTEIFIPGCDAPCRIQIISPPVVVMNNYFHGSSARATIIWDCAFSEADRVPFTVPEQVPWSTMFNALNSKFTAVVRTQHNLDQHSQHCLAEKIFNKPDCADDFSNMMVSWAQFNEELLPGRPFTFWEWFEGLMELTKTHLKTYWSEGLIFGVIGEQKLHQILRDSPTGTFLLHFSDSQIEGITITFMSATEKGEPKIQSIPPFTKRALNICSLGNRIRAISHITHLYPDLPKDKVFKRFYSEPSQYFTSLRLQFGLSSFKHIYASRTPKGTLDVVHKIVENFKVDADLVQALVLLFYRPPTDPDAESLLSVLLLPVNTVLQDVLRTRKRLVGDEIYIETSPHCKLRPKQEYTLSTCPEDDSVLVQPKKAVFDCDNCDNYFPSFQVFLEKNKRNINLVLRGTNSSSTVWEGEVDLLSTCVRGSCRQDSSSQRLLDIRSSFISRISGPVLKSLLDKLLEKMVLTDSERELADEIQNQRDKARFVIDTVRKKGEAASSEMIESLFEVGPFPCEHKEEPKIQSILPFTKRDRTIRSLRKRIRDISRITPLYPDLPKDFKRFYSEPQMLQDFTSLPLMSGLSRTKEERPVGSHSTEALSPLKKYSDADIPLDPRGSMDPSSQSSSSSKRRKENSIFYGSRRKKRYEKASSTVVSSIDLHDMLDQPPPVTLPETEMIINQSSAADDSTGFSQDNTREMDLNGTAGPSTLQLSTSDSAAFYDKTKERDEMSPDSPPSLVTDFSLHLPSRKETDDGDPSFGNSSSTFSRPSCSQSTTPTVCGPPCPQDSPVVLQDSTVCTEGSRAQDAFELLSLQSEGESRGDSDAGGEMEASVKAVKSSVTDTQPTQCLLQRSSSDPGWTERDSSCLSRSHSVPSLSQTTSPENKTLSRSQSLPDLLLKSSFEEFTPDISVDEDDETYWFQCSCPGLYQCSVTGLVFHMEGEGDVVYRTVCWDRRLLAQHHKKPAGPLFDIKCLQQSVCQLHLPHCEIRSTGEFLSVAHVNDEDIEFIVPQKITETHVIINITGFSCYGNVKDEDSPPDLVRALVLLFYRPPADPDPESFLDVFLLPDNMKHTWNKLARDEIHIKVPPYCDLRPKQKYTLSTCPEDDSVLVQPTEAEFYDDNYDNNFSSFQVIFKKAMKHIKLCLRETKSSKSVWERQVYFSSTAVKRSCGPSALNLPPDDRLSNIRSSFIGRISGPNLASLLDKLFDIKVLSEAEKDYGDKIPNERNKACFVVDTVRKKGKAASSEMIKFLCEIDPFLCEDLGLSEAH